ncbi:MAG: arginase family protein, partial [Planctomycetota bacterium]
AENIGERSHTRLMALGGDHSIAYSNIKATWKRLGSPEGGLALIHLDSHLDTLDSLWGEKYSHASPFIRLIEEGVIDPRFMCSIGIKGPMNAADDMSTAKQQGINVVTHDEWRMHDGEDRVRAFVRRLEGRATYVSFDIDCVDPVYAPGTGTPSVGGFTSAEILVLLRSFAGVNIVGADVVEVLPERDVAGNTSLLAAHIVFELIALHAIERRGDEDRAR